MVIGTYILIRTLNVNGLNAPTKRQRLAERIQKQDPCTCCLQEAHFRPIDHFNRRRKSFRQNLTPIYDKNSPESGHRGNLPQHNKGRI